MESAHDRARRRTGDDAYASLDRTPYRSGGHDHPPKPPSGDPIRVPRLLGAYRLMAVGALPFSLLDGRRAAVFTATRIAEREDRHCGDEAHDKTYADHHGDHRKRIR